MRKIVSSKRSDKNSTINCNSLERHPIIETIDLDSSFYDIESDSEDTYYEFESLEEYRKFLKIVGAD